MSIEMRGFWSVSLILIIMLYPISFVFAQSVKTEIKAERSLKGAENRFRKGSLKLVRYLNRAAGKKWGKGQNEKAIQLYERVLSIQKKQLGYNHPDTLKTIGRLASLSKNKSSEKSQKNIKDKLSLTKRKTETILKQVKIRKGHVANLSVQYKTLKKKSDRLKRTIQSKSQELIKIKQKKNATFRTVSGHKRRLQSAENILGPLNAALTRKQRSEKILQNKVNRLRVEERNAKSILSATKNKQRRDQRAVNLIKAKIRQLGRTATGGGRLRRLRNELARVGRAQGSVRGKLAKLARQKNAISRKLRGTKDSKTQAVLRRQLAGIRSTEQRVRRSARGYPSKIRWLQQKISRLNSANSRAKRQLVVERRKLAGYRGRERQNSRRISQAQSRLKTVQVRLRRQIALLKTVKRHMAEAKRKVVAQHKKVKNIRSNLRSVQQKIAGLNRQLMLKRKGIQKSQSQLSQMNSRLSAIQNKQVVMRRSMRKSRMSLRQSRQQERNLTNSLRVVKKMESRIQDDLDPDPIRRKSTPKPLTDSSEQVVRVYYGTDRNDFGEKKGTDRYGAERAKFSYGYSDVAIPPNHVPGELETYSWLKFEFKQNPKKHVTLTEIIRLEKDAFFEILTGRVDSTESRDAFIFIHGYYNSFKDATRRTAQMTFDMGFEGAPIMYSWPSQGTAKGYIRDESNVEWGELHLQEFILDIIKKTKPSRLHLIAHSMGSRALAKALVNLRQQLSDQEQESLKEIILAAPDIDAATFLQNIAPKIMNDDSRITLYTSKKDKALEMSERFNGFGRLGNMDSLKQVPEGIDVIDATEVTTSFVGHSYFGSNKSIITDMRSILVFSTPLNKRCYLKLTTTEIGRYWLFVLGACDDVP